MNNEQNFFNSDCYSQDSYSHMNFQEQYALNNAAIKEKLNLHVKRRLLETTPFVASYTSTSINNTNTPCIAYDDSSCGPSKPKSKRGRRSKKTSTVTSGSLDQEPSLYANQNNDCKAFSNFGKNLFNPPILTTNSSNQHMKNNKIKEKDKNQEMDQLVKILNEKKLSIMNDPSIISILDNITMKLRAKKNSANQNN